MPAKWVLRTLSATLMALWLITIGVAAQATCNPRVYYDKQEYMIPMRDGVKLYTQVYVPKDNETIPRLVILRQPAPRPAPG